MYIGKPVDNEEHVDYVPTLFKYTRQPLSSIKRREERQNRIDKRRQVAEAAESEKENQENAAEALLLLQDSLIQVHVDCETQTGQPETKEAATQASSLPSMPTPLTPAICYVPVESRAKSTVFTSELLSGNDDGLKFYTGLPSWKVFNHLVSFLSACYPNLKTKLSPADGILLTLMRLRLNLRIEDLSYHFGIGISTSNDVFHRWIDIMHFHLKFLIKWPTQETCRSNMPQIFKALYPRTRCIIDCSEIFIERPYSYQARAQTYSNYKKHNTVKFLVGITPCGAISFLSKCWGGRATDKCITMNSGFLQLLEPGDVVLADRGFDIGDDIALHGAKLEIPSFTRGKKQLSMQEVEYTKRIAKVRIHVERVIGLLKNKYTILQAILPVCILKHKDDTDFAFIDKILTVCAALTNLSPGVVPP